MHVFILSTCYCDFSVYIPIFQIPRDILEIIKKSKEAAHSHHQTVQPYIIELRNFYIVIDELQYQLRSVKEAFDTCFKLFFAANAKYPPQDIYMLIQRSIYKLFRDCGTTIPYIVDIIELLNQ